MNKKIWFTSDLHLMQKNIVKCQTKWTETNTDSLRDFNNEVEMTETIINNINKYVSEHDELYILGDLYLGKDLKEIFTLLARINCKNRHLILGNHDYIVTNNLNQFERKFDTISSYKELSLKFPLPEQDPNRDKWGGRQKIVMCHYAMRVWNRSHHGSWMLYGHSHSSLDAPRKQRDLEDQINEYYRDRNTMDVGIDNVFRLTGEYRPISFEEIQAYFSNRVNLNIDHHN